MDKQKQAAGETASNYPKRARLFSPDGHAGKDIITTVSDEYVERFVRNHARRIGWKCSVRAMKPKAAEPTCDNCASMTLRQTNDGSHCRWRFLASFLAEQGSVVHQIEPVFEGQAPTHDQSGKLSKRMACHHIGDNCLLSRGSGHFIDEDSRLGVLSLHQLKL